MYVSVISRVDAHPDLKHDMDSFSGIHSATCREENKVSSKLGALLVLRGLLNLEINPESIPKRMDEETGFDTIVEADYVRAVDGVEVER